MPLLTKIPLFLLRMILYTKSLLFTISWLIIIIIIIVVCFSWWASYITVHLTWMDRYPYGNLTFYPLFSHERSKFLAWSVQYSNFTEYLMLEFATSRSWVVKETAELSLLLSTPSYLNSLKQMNFLPEFTCI